MARSATDKNLQSHGSQTSQTALQVQVRLMQAVIEPTRAHTRKGQGEKHRELT